MCAYTGINDLKIVRCCLDTVVIGPKQGKFVSRRLGEDLCCMIMLRSYRASKVSVISRSPFRCGMEACFTRFGNLTEGKMVVFLRQSRIINRCNHVVIHRLSSKYQLTIYGGIHFGAGATMYYVPCILEVTLPLMWAGVETVGPYWAGYECGWTSCQSQTAECKEDAGSGVLCESWLLRGALKTIRLSRSELDWGSLW